VSYSKALEYLFNRGIQKRTIEEFRLGYAPDKRNFLEQFIVQKKSFLKEELEASGLVFKTETNQLIDRFRDRIMFPLLDNRGNVVGFSGRLLRPRKDVGKYINTPETLIYHKSQLLFGLIQAKEAIRQSKQAIVVEGEFDMISPYQAGIKNIVAVKGSTLTEEQIRLLHRFTKEILLALDEDSAGDAASRRGIQMAVSQGLNVRVVRLAGKFKDPDEAVQKDVGFLKKQIKKAVPIFDFYIDSALSRFDTNTAWGKKQTADELAPILAKIDDEVLRSHYIQRLARELGVAEEAIWEKVNSSAILTPAKAGQRITPVQSEELPRRQETLVYYLFSICFQHGKEKLLLDQRLSKFITLPAQKQLIRFLKKYFKENKKFVSRRFVQSLPSELLEIFNGFYLNPLPDKLTDKGILEGEVEKIKKELKLAFWRQEIARLSKEVVLKEKEGKDKDVVKLQIKINKLLKKIGLVG